MSQFIKNPNLPEGKVASLICGGLNDELIKFFLSRNIKLFFTDRNELVDSAVSDHCDISACYIGNGNIVADKNQKRLIAELSDFGLNVIKSEESVCGAYPEDIILNQAIVGDYHIGRLDKSDKAIMMQTENLKSINVKQGYAKCSILIVDETSIITDDPSIYKNSLQNGLECLLVSKGDIFLGGHDYGFIGGASGKISRDEIVFFGDASKHQDFNKIKIFIEERGCKIIYFESFTLTDYGGIIPLTEI